MKTRFCPSPTGRMHIGNVRTALFNVLLAYGHAGNFLLRIEDTDKERSKIEFADALMHDLCWLDCIWNEGPDADKGNGPYWQSQRQAIYDQFYDKLMHEQKAYPCFCSEAELSVMRKIQTSQGKAPRYAGTCRHLSPEEIQEKIASGIKPTLRFRIPDNQTIVFQDLVRGEQRFNSNDIGDFIIRRSDGTSPFMFCSAIDDALMGVTHALRGEDHLTNTPRQLLILQALGLTPPIYGHISLILGQDGAPLSKRNGSRSVEELRAEGYLPLAIINYLARLGHHYEENNFFSLMDLAKRFDVSHLVKAPARMDSAQLLFWQREAVAHLSESEFWDWLGESVHPKIPHDKKEAFIKTAKPNVLFPSDAAFWAERFFQELSFSDEAVAVLKEANTDYFIIAELAVKEGANTAPALIQALKEKTSFKGKALFQPLRVALSGELHGPELAMIFDLLGENLVQKRLSSALHFLEKQG